MAPQDHAHSSNPPRTPPLLSPDCCYFNCMDLDLDLFSWTGLTSATSRDDVSDIQILDSAPISPGTTLRGSADPPTQQAHPYQRSRTLSHHNTGKTYNLAGHKLRPSQSSQPLGPKRRLLKSSRLDDHPPPVIALSRSSFSTGSSNSESSTLESTEVDSDHHHSDIHMRKSYSMGGYDAIANSLYKLSKVRSTTTLLRKEKEDGDRRFSRQQQEESAPHLIEHDEKEDHEGRENEHDRDYAALHELLLNSLFEDAKARQQLAQQSPPPSPLTPPVDDEGYVTPTNSSHKTVSIASPESNNRDRATRTGAYRLKRKTSNQSASSWNSRTSLHSKHSKYSKTSRGSSTSTKSDLLTPSSHQFKRSLGKRRRIHALPLLQVLRPRRYRKNKKLQQMEAMSVHHGSSPNVVTPSSRRDDSSISCASTTTFTTHDGEPRNISSTSTSSASSFLEDWCDLQKDSGKGYAPGTSVTAHGKDDSMTKLVEKMDVLAEVENVGAYANAMLTRVPAKLMSSKRGGTGSLGSECSQSGAEGYVETRSMLAVKMGLLSIKYGVLVHWNKASGLAELIVLRKMCSESFMKPGVSKGSWRKRMKHRVGRKGSMGINTTFATMDTMSTDNASYNSFGLDPIDSYTNRVDDSFG